MERRSWRATCSSGAFLGWVVATERRSHIAITQFSERASPRLQRLLGWAGDIGIVVLMVWLLWFGVKLVDNNRDVETVTLFFNHAVVYAVLPVAAIAIGGLTVARMRERDSANDHADARYPGALVCAAVHRRADLCADGACRCCLHCGGRHQSDCGAAEVAEGGGRFPPLAAPMYILMGSLMNTSVSPNASSASRRCAWAGGKAACATPIFSAA